MFNGAALVGLSWPYVLMDVLSQQALLRVWSLVLSCRDMDVLPVLGAEVDALCIAVNALDSDEKFKMDDLQLKGAGFISFGLLYAWDSMSGPAAQSNTTYMPVSTLAVLQREAEADLAKTTGDVSYLSDNDILTAWAARIVASSQ